MHLEPTQTGVALVVAISPSAIADATAKFLEKVIVSGWSEDAVTFGKQRCEHFERFGCQTKHDSMNAPDSIAHK